MTVGKKFKKRVRERMKTDGVQYTEALRRVKADEALKHVGEKYLGAKGEEKKG